MYLSWLLWTCGLRVHGDGVDSLVNGALHVAVVELSIVTKNKSITNIYIDIHIHHELVCTMELALSSAYTWSIQSMGLWWSYCAFRLP